MTTTLVTGAAGFTGRYLTDRLRAQGHEVHGLVHHRSDGAAADGSTVHVADLTDRPSLSRIVQQVRPDYVVHLAAIAFVGHDDVEEMYRTNIVGTRQLLDVLSELDPSPKAVIIASSANVYGIRADEILDESMSPLPANDYGVTKVGTENVGRLYAGRLPIIVVRPFNYTGLGQANNFLIPKIIDHARRRAPVIELGNVDVARDFSDVRTVVDTYARLLEAPSAIGQTLNICSGRAISLREILDMVERHTGHRFEVTVNPALVRANEVRSLAGSAARLTSVIGDLKSIPLEKTLQWMLGAEGCA